MLPHLVAKHGGDHGRDHTAYPFQILQGIGDVDRPVLGRPVRVNDQMIGGVRRGNGVYVFLVGGQPGGEVAKS